MKNTKKAYCIVCRTNTNSAGLTIDDGTHICYDCAELIHNVMGQWHESHPDQCKCQYCQQNKH